MDASRHRVVRRPLGTAPARERTEAQGGFTLIELSIAVALSAFIFLALAMALGGALRSAQVQKTRTLANEVATQGIEDLQRFKYANLGLCGAPTRPFGLSAPAGFATVITVNCTNASIEEPCTPTTFSPGLTAQPVPKESYGCTKANVLFTVSRYVAWGDATQTGKRLAVVVDWQDSAGRHQVAQQSSLRAPDAAAIIGVAPPAFSTAFPPTANPSSAWVDSNGNIVLANGSPSSITLTATTTGLSASDQVFATIMALDPASGQPIVQQYQMTSADGSNWQGTIPGAGQVNAPKIGVGTQYVGFTLLRNSDGKANSTFAVPANRFCGGAGSGNCSISGTVPTISGSTSAAQIPLDPDGAMQTGSSLGVTATTSNVTISDTVTVTLQTQAGMVPIALKPSAACGTNPGTVCNSWSATVTPSAGYRFNPGPQYLYFAANQVIGNAPDIGSTAAAQSTFSVNFT